MGVSERTVARLKPLGLPMPLPDEDLARWAERAKSWQLAARRRPGPRPAVGGDAKAQAELEYRRLRAQKLQLEVDVLRGELHSRKECEATAVQRLTELRATFTQLPDRLARRLYQAPSPDAIKLVVEEELRRCFDSIARGGPHDVDGVDAGDAERPPVA